MPVTILSPREFHTELNKISCPCRTCFLVEGFRAIINQSVISYVKNIKYNRKKWRREGIQNGKV